MLDQQQTVAFKSRLRERAERLRGEVRQTLARSSEETPARIAEQVRDLEDESLSALIVDTNLAEIDRDIGELQLIDTALQRLSAGIYDICVDCEQPIPLRRLEAEPTAIRCVQCQERFEKTHVSSATPSL
jgi:RNA polymerase-binding protein DksA